MSINVEEYYIKYGPMVLRRCRFLLKDENKAMDAMQETFVKLLRYQQKLNNKAPSSLLYTIATNICLNVIRKESKHRETKDDSMLYIIASSENIEEHYITKDILQRIFKDEKVSTNQIAVMHYIDRMTHEQIAKEIGLSVSGVRKRLRNLKSKVRELKEELV